MSDDTVIEMQAISKVFYTDDVETHALADVSLTIGRGEYVSISGPSGCGKSTLLSILGLLDTPTAGHYVLNGRRVEDLTMADRAQVRNREIGFIFQSFNLIGRPDPLRERQAPPDLPKAWAPPNASSAWSRRSKRSAWAHRAKHPCQVHFSGGTQQPRPPWPRGVARLPPHSWWPDKVPRETLYLYKTGKSLPWSLNPPTLLPRKVPHQF